MSLNPPRYEQSPPFTFVPTRQISSLWHHKGPSYLPYASAPLFLGISLACCFACWKLQTAGYCANVLFHGELLCQPVITTTPGWNTEAFKTKYKKMRPRWDATQLFLGGECGGGGGKSASALRALILEQCSLQDVKHCWMTFKMETFWKRKNVKVPLWGVCGLTAANCSSRSGGTANYYDPSRCANICQQVHPPRPTPPPLHLATFRKEKEIRNKHI